MPANIFGERVIVNRVPAWHKLGVVFDEPMSTVDAISKAGLDYRVDLLPLYYEYNDDLVDSSQRAIVRQPTVDDPRPRFFGSVSDRYRVIQNDEIARATSPLSDKWPVESAGALGWGESFFLSFKAGDSQVANEEIVDYFLLVDDKTGTHALKLLFTPVRVVCQNTLIAAMSSSIPVKLRHLESLSIELEDYVAVLSQADASKASLMLAFNKMAECKVTEEDALKIIAKAYPTPKPSSRLRPYVAVGNDGDYLLRSRTGGLPEAVHEALEQWQVSVERTKADRGNVYMLYDQISASNHVISDSPWAVWNAVVEYEDHLRTRTGPSGGLGEIFGDRARAKERGYQASMAVVLQ